MSRIINKNSIISGIENDVDHIILIDKPVDWTSFDVVKKIKNIGKYKKVGHAGTLDPFAEGLLIIGTGNETKNLSSWSNAGKIYEAVIEFGKQTDTYDLTGEVTGVKEIVTIDWDKIDKVLHTFIGKTEQIPPMFSAKKIKGVRLYKLARKGKEVDRDPKVIHISYIDILDKKGKELKIKLQCSKGTYVRTLANDIGIKSGYFAYLKSLKRIAIGDLSVTDALSIGQFETLMKKDN